MNYNFRCKFITNSIWFKYFSNWSEYNPVQNYFTQATARQVDEQCVANRICSIVTKTCLNNKYFGKFYLLKVPLSIICVVIRKYFLTRGTVWWFTSTDMRGEVAPCSCRLQNTLYRWMGKSDNGGSQLSSPHKVPFTLTSEPTDNFRGGPGGFGAAGSKASLLLLALNTAPSILTVKLSCA